MIKKYHQYSQIGETKRKIKFRRIIFKVCSVCVLLIPFLILILPIFQQKSTLYVFVIDESASMGEEFSDFPGNSKMDMLKVSLIEFIDYTNENDIFMVSTFGNGNYKNGLDEIIQNSNNCGGEIIISLSNDKDYVIQNIEAISVKESNTHLSEGLYKTFLHIESNNSQIQNVNKIEILLFSDGQDHCNAIEEGKNVAILDWSFRNIVSLNCIGIEVSEEKARENLTILANDCNGEYIEVTKAENLYMQISKYHNNSKNINILYTHIGISALLLILILMIV